MRQWILPLLALALVIGVWTYIWHRAHVCEASGGVYYRHWYGGSFKCVPANPGAAK